MCLAGLVLNRIEAKDPSTLPIVDWNEYCLYKIDDTILKAWLLHSKPLMPLSDIAQVVRIVKGDDGLGNRH